MTIKVGAKLGRLSPVEMKPLISVVTEEDYKSPYVCNAERLLDEETEKQLLNLWQEITQRREQMIALVNRLPKMPSK